MKENTNTFKDAGAGKDPDKFSALNPRRERAQRRGSLQVWPLRLGHAPWLTCSDFSRLLLRQRAGPVPGGGGGVTLA